MVTAQPAKGGSTPTAVTLISKRATKPTATTRTTVKLNDKRLDAVHEELELQQGVLQERWASFIIGMLKLSKDVLSAQQGHAKLKHEDTLCPTIINIKAPLQEPEELKGDTKMEAIKEDWDKKMNKFKKEMKLLHNKSIKINIRFKIKKRWTEFIETAMHIADLVAKCASAKIGCRGFNPQMLGAAGVCCSMKVIKEGDDFYKTYSEVKKEMFVKKTHNCIHKNADEVGEKGRFITPTLTFLTDKARNV